MPNQWLYQVRGRLRPRLDVGLGRDLEGLVRNAGGETNSLALPRTDHPLPRHLPYAFAEGIPPAHVIPGPAFGPRLAYDGSRFDGLSGAEIRDGELLLGLRAIGLEREVGVGIDGIGGAALTGIEALLDFLTRVLGGPEGEVVGRMLNEYHVFGHPLVRCADGRIRLVHVSGMRRDGGPGHTLPREIPAWCVEAREGWVGDLDEDALLGWFREGAIEAG